MSPFRLLYRIVSSISMWLAPIILIIISISFTLTNSVMHKSTLRSSDFYNKLSNELQTNKITSADLDKGFSSILLSSVFSDLATPGWLQNLFERNIDNTANWLDGKSQNWIIYLPTKEIEVSISNQLDSQTKDITKDFGNDIKECNQDQSEKIKREGFDLESDFCLPAEVKNGTQTLSQFLQVSGENVQSSTYLNSIVRNNALNPFSDQIKAENIFASYSNGEDILGFANIARDGLLAVKKAVPYMIVSLLVLLVLQVFLARINNRKITHEIRHYLFYVVVGVFALACLLILSFGGTILLTSALQRYLLPSLGSQQLIYLISLEVVKFAFNLISVAVWIALGMVFSYLTIIFFEKSTLIINAREKNQKYKQRSAIIGSDNRTFDGQFHSILDKNPSLLNKTVAPVQTNIDAIDKTAFNGPMDFSEPGDFVDNNNPNQNTDAGFTTPTDQLVQTSTPSVSPVNTPATTLPNSASKPSQSVINPPPPTNNIRGL